MKKTNKLLIGVGLVALAGIIIYTSRRYQINKRYSKIADEGYETAHDILYPPAKHSSKRVHYGPVLPE